MWSKTTESDLIHLWRKKMPQLLSASQKELSNGSEDSLD